FHRVFYHLWLCEWPRQVNQAYTSDPTMMYIAMAALNRDGSFMQAKDLTEVLAQFTYDIQLVVLRQMHYDIRHHSQTVHTQLWALRPLLKYVHEDEVTTFGSIRAMQHYASALAFSWRGMPSVMWKDPGRYEEMVFEGKPLPLHKLRELCHSLQASAIEIFEELSAKGQTDIPYDQLEDNLKNLTTGYTVVDYRNSEIMRERFAAFSEHLLSCDKWNLRRNVDGREVLHSRNCDQWLARLAELEERLLVLTLLASGAPPRGTEATALLLRNTPYRQRNLYLFGRQLAFVRMYNKTTHTHAHDKVIPNGFDAVTKDIAARTWFYLRPHAECFSQEVFGEEGKEIAQLYRTMMFMDYGKMFSSHALTRKMSGLTTSVLGWPMTIRKWRQIYPAIRRKHPSTSLGKPDGDDVDDVEERIEEDDPIDTRQAGHSMAIAKRLYGITADVVTGLDPDSIFVYLANSDEVQHLLRLVPGSHALPYYEATADQYPAVVRASRNQPHRSETSAQPTAGESSNGDTLTVGAATTLVESLWSKISDRLDRIEATEIRLQAQINDLHTQLAGGAAPHTPTRSGPPTPQYSPGMQSVRMRVEEDEPSYQDDEQTNFRLFGTWYANQENHLLISFLGRRVAGAVPRSPQSDTSSKSSLPHGNPRKKRVVSRRPSLSDGKLNINNATLTTYLTITSGQLFQPFRFEQGSPPPAQEPRDIILNTRSKYVLVFEIPRELECLHDRPLGHHEQPDENDVVMMIRRILRNPSAGWSCIEQRAAFINLVQKTSDIILALRTGAGKSLIFILAALYDPGVTIIMIPLKALVEDWIRRLIEWKIPYEYFSDSSTGEIKGKAKIIIVSLDVAQFPAWISKLRAAASGGLQIMRIVVDEAHLIFSSDFRPCMKRINEIRFVNAQVVLSSATLPPSTIPF
ncbi:hypothetical protein EV122DRAFT_181637, partial [Schizophyllum commune]